MRVIIRSNGRRFWIPVPYRAAGLGIAMIPQKTLDHMQTSLPKQVRGKITKEMLQFLYQECKSILREYKGLEIIRVEARDGTFVSIKL